MKHDFDFKDLLDNLDPSALDYQGWLNVGMALKDAGQPVSVWDAWSAKDSARYHFGECPEKWATFGKSNNRPVTMATVCQMAMDQGYMPEGGGSPGYELDWDSVIGPAGSRDDLVVVNKGWIEDVELQEPGEWKPAEQLVTYLETLFEAAETVGYVTDSWYDPEKNKHFPKKGNWDRTAGQLIQALREYGDDIGAVLGDYNPDVGAWIRFNPLDGKGVKNENITEFKYALVESDNMPIGQQNAILRQLELPIACLVHSGGKSLHAIVRIDATDYKEYQSRVEYLYDVCRKNGFSIDKQNKNPSRLSRMPGVTRNGHKQWLIDTNIGRESWNDWREWIESVNDDLPDPVSLADVWDNMPPLSPSLIDGVLRQGHKMMLAGPSKAGKSYMLIGLCVALAEGREWVGWPCAQTKVLYINLEVDSASAMRRFKAVYEALGWAPKNIRNIEVWNLRGKAIPMDKLSPKLIRRAIKKGYGAIILDPIYKVITGDENSADEMAHFCNQFDLLANQLGAAMIYCHHHSKGYQGGKKSMDRSSGSGVFARDPDAYLDMTELEKTPEILKLLQDKACCEVCARWIQNAEPIYYDDHVGQDDLQSANSMMVHAKNALTKDQYDSMCNEAMEAQKKAKKRTAWRIEGTLREYEGFEPRDVWFVHPVHVPDDSDLLKDLAPETEKPAWKKAVDKRKPPEKKKTERANAIEIAFASFEMDGEAPTTEDLAEAMGVSVDTVRRRVKDHGGLKIIRQGDGKSGLVMRVVSAGKNDD